MAANTRKAKNRTGPIEPGGVDEYIAATPKEVRGKLMKIRAAIREAAPGSAETVSYFHMPGYSYAGYDYQGMFAWFSFKKPDVRLHVRPPVLQDHKRELGGFAATRSMVRFPADKEIPADLVKKLVKASLKEMKGKGK